MIQNQTRSATAPCLFPAKGAPGWQVCSASHLLGALGTTRAHTHQQPSGSCIHNTCDATPTSCRSMTFLMRLVCDLGLKQPLTACAEPHVPSGIMFDGTDRSQIILQPEGLWYKLTSPPAAPASSPAPWLLSHHPCLAWQTEKSLRAFSTQFCSSTRLHLSCSTQSGDLPNTCLLLFFLQQQQQQQTPNVIRSVPPTTDIAMIRASKFTKGFDKTCLAHTDTAA